MRDFRLPGRRFEYKGTFHGAELCDDYAHHPGELATLFDTAAALGHQRVVCPFQPHTYTRTKMLFQEFVDALSHTDHIILAEIYAARETDTLGISSKDIADALNRRGCDAYYFPTFNEIQDFCMEKCQKGDLLITMGAGDVVNIGEALLKR